jgi:hypothetical protein
MSCDQEERIATNFFDRATEQPKFDGRKEILVNAITTSRLTVGLRNIQVHPWRGLSNSFHPVSCALGGDPRPIGPSRARSSTPLRCREEGETMGLQGRKDANNDEMTDRAQTVVTTRMSALQDSNQKNRTKPHFLQLIHEGEAFLWNCVTLSNRPNCMKQWQISIGTKAGRPGGIEWLA